jgi:RNA polymerase sigma-70 factor (ECF subfamily)
MSVSVEGRPLDEAELIKRARAGDPAAFEELVRIHQLVALRVAYLVVGDHAGDVVQEAIMKAYRHLDRFTDGRPFRPWLLRVVRNEALNRHRREGRRARLELRVAADPVSGGAAPSPETVVVAAERRRMLLAAVDDLPERYRTTIAYRFLIGLSEAETATALGVPRGTVKSRTARGVERLRERLKEADLE